MRFWMNRRLEENTQASQKVCARGYRMGKTR